jgi:hypothetical protein
MLLTIYAGCDLMIRKYYMREIDKNWEKIEELSRRVMI